MWLAYVLTFYMVFILVFNSHTRIKYSKAPGSVMRMETPELISFVLAFGAMCIMSLFRGIHVGSDTISYVKFYNYVDIFFFFSKVLIETRMEPGFVLYVRVLVRLFHNPQSLIICSSAITMFFVMRFICKYSKATWLSIFIFYCLFSNASMNVMRQFLALSFVLWAFDYIIKKKFIIFSALVLLATTFHFSAFIFFIAYPLSKLKVTKKIVVLSVILAPFILIISFIIMSPFLKFMAEGDFLSYYNENNKYYAEGVKIATILLLVMYISFVYYGLKGWKIMTKRRIPMNQIDSTMLFFLIVGVFITLFSLPLNILNRFALYFNIFGIAFLPNTIHQFAKRQPVAGHIVVGVLLLSLYYLVINVYRPEWTHIYPYSFYE